MSLKVNLKEKFSFDSPNSPGIVRAYEMMMMMSPPSVGGNDGANGHQ